MAEKSDCGENITMPKKRLSASERRLLDSLFQEHHAAMLKLACSILGDRGLAEDAAQQVFVRITGHMPKLADIDPGRIRSFLFLVTRRICLDMLRSRKHDAGPLEYADDVPDGADYPEDIVIRQDQLDIIRRHLADIDDDMIDILALQIYYGFKEWEIAEFFSLTPENVRVRIHRARKRLKQDIAKGELRL
ncbi:MAG: sigma-70 family RNA polymerase sigma factor [Gracilibacteraceae bacterium]|jgi:RNA polymerase sigma-70 factor (ECF subfamily)|nr:sigma-70 family RNA polymerase sigma factor [Gracilibacteraceae bacterium]